jgi:ribosomal protein S18 acetylase RimI-like enzyme
MRPVDRVQEYIRENTRSSHVNIAAPPFTVFLNFAMLLKPDDPKAIFAIPDCPTPQSWLFDAMFDAFRRQQGHPRVQLIDTYTPDLLPLLEAQGFSEDKRHTVMTVTPQTLIHPAEPDGFSLLICSSESPLDDIIAGCTINVRGFDEDIEITQEFAEDFRSTLVTARAFMASQHGEGVAAGMYTDVRDGVTELVGITTLHEYRRQGFAATLAAHMSHAAFENGVDLIFLIAANEDAVRVYERIGFTVCGYLVDYEFTRISRKGS